MPNNPNDLPSDDDLSRQEDALDAILRQPAEPALDGWPDPPAEPVPINAAAERQAFAELLALLSSDDDAETEVVAISLDDFDAASIPSPATDLPPAMPDEEYQP